MRSSLMLTNVIGETVTTVYPNIVRSVKCSCILCIASRCWFCSCTASDGCNSDVGGRQCTIMSAPCVKCETSSCE